MCPAGINEAGAGWRRSARIQAVLVLGNSDGWGAQINLNFGVGVDTQRVLGFETDPVVVIKASSGCPRTAEGVICVTIWIRCSAVKVLKATQTTARSRNAGIVLAQSQRRWCAQINQDLAVAVVTSFVSNSEAVVFVISGAGHRLAGVAVGYRAA